MTNILPDRQPGFSTAILHFIYHNGSIQSPKTGGSFRRSVCIEELRYEADGRMKRVVQTTEGLNGVG